MNKIKRITANLPEDLLLAATKITSKGITETIIEGLDRIKRSEAFLKAQRLRGKLDLQINISKSRERSRS